ncbi:hypothetical protein LR48_Vigan04g113900 [Vigna angularis]|uniref:Uncharacterized protein n=1 Tax=Phaseolus angularis TaxID=3914 RepID=A0A0L9UE29_PHAAN|nr:hypothetical protein LR48_Vigan04g113900 [Vigna angularis]
MSKRSQRQGLQIQHINLCFRASPFRNFLCFKRTTRRFRGTFGNCQTNKNLEYYAGEGCEDGLE